MKSSQCGTSAASRQAQPAASSQQDETPQAFEKVVNRLPQGPGQEPIVVMAPKETLPCNLRVHLRGNRFTLGPTVPRGEIQIVAAATQGLGDTC